MNHMYGNWFIPVSKLWLKSISELQVLSENKGYRESTRRNALSIANEKQLNKQRG